MPHPHMLGDVRRRWLAALSALVLAGALLVVLVPGSPARADDARVAKFPDRLITIVVPWPAGGRTDAATRIWAPFFEQEVGVPVVVANRPGGGGVVGARAVARAGADGYSHGVFSISHILAQWTKTPPFELEAYTPVLLAFSTPFVLAVKADAPWKSVADFVGAARAGELKSGNSGTGTSGHVAAEAFYKTAGVKLRAVPYEGDAPAVAALVRGEVDAVMVPMIGVASHVKGGTLRALGVSLDTPDALHEGIPTFKAQGVDFVLGDLGGGVFVPRGTPKGIVDKIEASYVKVFANPELREQLRKAFIEVDPKGTSEFQAILERWNPVLRDLTRELGLHVQR